MLRSRGLSAGEWENTTGHVIAPTCHYDVIEYMFVAKWRSHYDVIMASQPYHVTSSSSKLNESKNNIVTRVVANQGFQYLVAWLHFYHCNRGK